MQEKFVLWLIAVISIMLSPVHASTISDLHSVQQSNSEFIHFKNLTDTNCHQCRKKRMAPVLQIEPDEDRLKQVHIEMIKQQILLKLSLESEPNITRPLSSLPQPIYEGEVTMRAKESWISKQKKDEGFYGKTEQIVILADEDDEEGQPFNLCRTKRLYPTGCFTFRFPNSINPMTITSVDLWAFKLEEDNIKAGHTFVISEVSKMKTTPHLVRKKTIGVEQVLHKRGWIRFEMDAWVLRRWLMKKDLFQTIEISCKSCEIDLEDSPVSSEFSHRPFFVVNNDPNLETRVKRSLNCNSQTTECCKMPFTVSFDEIGWSNWIIEPQQYTAYYCRGSCADPVSVPLARYQHSSMRQRLLAMKDDLPNHLREELTPCCAPTKMSSLMIAYLEDNRIVQTKVLPNMIVESCGCL